MEHRHLDLLTPLRPRALLDQDGVGPGEGGGRGNLLLKGRGDKQRSEGLHLEVPHQKPEGPPSDDEASRPRVHPRPQQLIFQHLSTPMLHSIPI